MERKHTIGISFDSSYFTQIFVHTSGSYLKDLVSKDNNRYLANLGLTHNDERVNKLLLELNNGSSKIDKEKITNELKAVRESYKSPEVISLTFKDKVEDLNGYIVFEPMTAFEQYDLALLDFLSYNFLDFNDFLLFFINFFDYFIDKLDNYDIRYLQMDTLYPVSTIVEIAKKYFPKEKLNLMHRQSYFKDCVNFVYNINYDIDFKNLTHKQRFYLYNQLYSGTFEDYKHDFHSSDVLDYAYNDFIVNTKQDLDSMIASIEEADPTGRKLSNLQHYSTTNIFTSFYITLFNVVAVNKMHIKMCGNCGRYFITHKETVAYCDRDIGNNLTCKDVGNKEYQKRKLDSDATYDKYRKLGSRKQLRASRNPQIEKYQKDLEKFRKIGKQMYKDVCSGKISNEEFAKWVEEQNK